MAAPVTDKPQPAKTINLLLRVVGGEVPTGSFTQKVGPHGVNSKKLGEVIKNLTAAEHKAQKVHVMVKIQGREAECKLHLSTPQMIIHELREMRELKKKGEKVIRGHNGNLRLSSLFKIMGEIKDRSRSNSFKNTLKEILGSCLSVGCTVEGKSPKEITAAINKGRNALAELCGMSDDIDSLPEFLDE